MSEQQKTILVIEDDHILQAALAKKLGSVGWKILQAYDGKAGLEMFKKEEPDMVLLDIAMPVMNGFEVLRSLKKQGRLDKKKIMIISNSIYEPLRNPGDEELLAGIEYMIKSNFSLQAIVDKIKQAVDNQYGEQ